MIMLLRLLVAWLALISAWAEEVQPPVTRPGPEVSGRATSAATPASTTASTPATTPAGNPAVPVKPGTPAAARVLVIPPSPSTVSGERIWPAPAFTHWPAVVYADEERNVAFGLPVRIPGASGSIGWQGTKALPFTLPNDLERISGLVPLPVAVGTYRADLTIAGAATAHLPLIVADAAAPWPLAALREGFPIDSAGVPVVLLDRRRDANQERKWALVSALQKPRPTGVSVVVGDLLTGLGQSAFTGLDARVIEAVDDRSPWHAQLVALARDMDGWEPQPLVKGPRTIMWSPGNRALLHNTWTPEEERFFGVVRTRCEALGIFPRLVLILPPAPIDDREPARILAAERREQLRRTAANQGWIVLDVERSAGSAEEAFKIGDHVFAEGPVGVAREHLAAALRTELAR